MVIPQLQVIVNEFHVYKKPTSFKINLECLLKILLCFSLDIG
jgi:hypothetical protein